MLDTDYEMPWRPNYDLRAAAGWVFAAAGIYSVHGMFGLPVEPCFAFSAISGTACAYRGTQGIKHYRRRRRLAGDGISFITHKELERRSHLTFYERLRKKRSLDEYLYLGTGFQWTQHERQLMADITSRDPKQIKLPDDDENKGKRWIHGLGAYEKEICVRLDFLNDHFGVWGTTGAGKTRFYDMFVTQAIRRNESVIVIDPKGDKELRDNMRRACELAGKADHFVQFHPAYPSKSCRLNPLKNYSRPTELASRIAALIPSETGADPFKAFCQNALNNIIQGMILVGQIPLLTGIKSLIDGGVDHLCIKAIQTYGDHFAPNWEKVFSRVLREMQDDKKNRGTDLEKQRDSMIRTYWEYIKAARADSDLEGLINMAQHNRDHLSRMIASLTPILGMLTSGEMGRLLSPDDNDATDTRRNLDLTRVMDNAMVLYVGLDSLSDSMVGSAIGSMLLSDITAIAGARYNYSEQEDLRIINIMVDEAAEVINDPFIQAMNKGRGAKLRLIVATQTMADFITRCGSEYKARMVLGNINNWVSFRVIDDHTQEYLASRMHETKIKYLMHTQGTSTKDGIQFTGNGGERLMSEDAQLFPKEMLGQLPNLEFIINYGGGHLWKGRLPVLVEKRPPPPQWKVVKAVKKSAGFLRDLRKPEHIEEEAPSTVVLPILDELPPDPARHEPPTQSMH